MGDSNYPIKLVRQQFPALKRMHNDKSAIYFDGPGGTQVVASAIEAMTNYMQRGGANLHGEFPTSQETENYILEARQAMGDLLGVSEREIAFGANATTLAFGISMALSRDWRPGDEIVVTELDHRGNVDPWITIAKDKGLNIRWIKVNTETLTLDLSDLDKVINEKTVLVAVGLASNAVGTINDVATVAARAKQVGAIVAVDAVQGVPHIWVDMDELGADIILCSAYKFFGPHIGVAAIRAELFEKLETYRLVPAPGYVPDKLETGTQNHEGIAGIKPAVEFIASLGVGTTRRQQLKSGYEVIEKHENGLASKIRSNLARMPQIKLYNAPENVRKTPTISFTIEGLNQVSVCKWMASEYSIFIASGNFYCNTLADKIDINKSGGWIRAGLSPYNSMEEVDNFIIAINVLLSSRLPASIKVVSGQ